ncbi:MAG TPA: hypothetical protein VEX86_13685, partial [Longimicrobium sp.]|nr:hypothetical protein [Longimicrobium sp.]
PHVRGMMRRRRIGMMVLAALALAGCGEKGGELRDATARRRAELADSTRDAEAAGGTAADTSTRLPVFADDTTPRTRPDSARADSAKADSAKAAPALGEWTVRGRSAQHGDEPTTLRGLRAAANAGFDRMVLDFGDQPIPGWKADYVDQPVHECGSGEPVRLGTDAVLRVRLAYTQAHDDAGRATLRQRDLPLNMPVMRRMVIICDFEGVVELAIGAASPRPYRITELRNPSRLVVDIQQQP